MGKYSLEEYKIRHRSGTLKAFKEKIREIDRKILERVHDHTHQVLIIFAYDILKDYALAEDICSGSIFKTCAKPLQNR